MGYIKECDTDDCIYYQSAMSNRNSVNNHPRKTGTAWHEFSELVAKQGRDLNDENIGFQWSWFHAGWNRGK